MYVLLRAVDRFQHTYGRLPGDNNKWVAGAGVFVWVMGITA
jgi:hypothetical protein